MHARENFSFMIGPEVSFAGRNKIIYQGREFLYLAGIDYHRMSTNPMIVDSVAKAVKEFGLSPTGSRVTTGNHKLYRELEEQIADFFGTESALVFPSGYLSNAILLQAITDEFDHFFMDEGSHSSMESAVKILGNQVIKFKSKDAQHLSELIEKHITPNGRILILTDGVFPGMGDLAPLNDYADLLVKYQGKLLVDDAHAMAVLGPSGKGTYEEFGLQRDMLYQTGSMSKGFGTLGGVIPGSQKLLEKIYQKSGGFIGSTGLALPLAAAGIRSIKYLKENPDLITKLQKQTINLKKKFAALGFAMPISHVPIFSVTFHDERRNQYLNDLLLKNGIYPPFVNYPGSPEGGQFRFILTSDTSEEEIDLLINTIKLAI